MKTVYKIPLWDKAGPFEPMPLWAAYSVEHRTVAKIPQHILATASHLLIACEKCSDGKLTDFMSAEPPPPSAMIFDEHYVELHEHRVHWGYDDGTSILCGLVWTGECSKCKTKYMTFRKATESERASPHRKY